MSNLSTLDFTSFCEFTLDIFYSCIRIRNDIGKNFGVDLLEPFMAGNEAHAWHLLSYSQPVYLELRCKYFVLWGFKALSSTGDNVEEGGDLELGGVWVNIRVEKDSEWKTFMWESFSISLDLLYLINGPWACRIILKLSKPTIRCQNRSAQMH